jgi:hypothetical protein
MTQFIFGMLAGVVVGLVMEWVIDWTGLLPKKSAADRNPPKSGQRGTTAKAKRVEKDAQVQSAVATSSSSPETSGK